MTKEQETKLDELMENVKKYLPLVNEDKNPFAFSSAKYYPALKELASK